MLIEFYGEKVRERNAV